MSFLCDFIGNLFSRNIYSVAIYRVYINSRSLFTLRYLLLKLDSKHPEPFSFEMFNKVVIVTYIYIYITGIAKETAIYIYSICILT